MSNLDAARDNPFPPKDPDVWGYCPAFGANLARHEIFGGSRREKSKRLGLWVWLCPTCHAEIHASGKRTLALHHVGQRAAMEYYGWTADEFRERFGVNYL